MHIKHITFYIDKVEKFEETIKFYETITELNVSRHFKSGPGEVVFLTNGDGETEIEFVYMPKGRKFEGKGMFVCFATYKIDEMHKLAVDRGLNPSPIQNPDPETRYFYVYDPNGVSVQLRFYPQI